MSFPTFSSVSRLQSLGVTCALSWLCLLVACSPSQPQGTNDSSPESAAVLNFVDPPAGGGAMAPNLSASRAGLVLTWLEPGSQGYSLRFSEFSARTWSEPRQIATGGTFLANWADVPQAAEASSGARLAHWLEMLGDHGHAYGAKLARSLDGGDTWQELGLLHDDASPTEHGFVSYVPLSDDAIQAFWLDGRAMPSGGGMQLRTAVVEEEPSASIVLDDRVCECCATDSAMTVEGPVVVYRDRSATEQRDISIVRATADGWTQPAVVHQDDWELVACPINGPAVAAHGQRVVVVWFTASRNRPRVQLAISSNAGAAFGPPILLDEARPSGRVDVVLGASGEAVATWIASTDEGPQLRWRHIGSDGTPGPLQVVTDSRPKLSGGFPRLGLTGEQVLLTWAEAGEPSRLRAAILDLPTPT